MRRISRAGEKLFERNPETRYRKLMAALDASGPALFAALALLAFQLGMMVYEQIALGWPFAREEVPIHDGWFALRTAANALLSTLLVAALARTGLRPEPLSRRAIGWTIAVAALSGCAALLLLASPAAYAAVGAEDGAIEWLTALFLFAGSAAMALRLRVLWRSPRTRPHRTLHLLAALGFVALFFVMAMEEVSWFQRQIGFDTPESVAAANWQGEFNLHNFQTDITELLLYAGTGLFLMLLPLVRESALAREPLLRPFAGLLPDRTVAALSAPMLVFTYSHWALLPVQAAFWIGFAACIAFAASAATRAEGRLWSALAAWIALGQLVHLLYGDTMLAIYDSSEYRELFFGMGLAAYGWRQWRAVGDRHRAAATAA